MFVRRLAATALLTALTLTTSACSMSGNVTSLQPYSPSDGQQVDLETIKARNFIYLVSASGNGYLVGSLVNSSAEARVVKIQYVNPNNQAKTDYFMEVPAGQKLDVGYNGNPAIELPVVETPGQTAMFYFLESDTVNATMKVPVLDGTLSEYRAVLELLEQQVQPELAPEPVS
ncbi:unannotated protein [freshwater metagenome]|uniref:Unannotated protein n=1 Tax=freshwater metagenome TaxID=449393 RepID=A0A6J6J7S8_9ZZZZ|nr:hypothetical protein [Actinomycetota bacterium]